MPLQISKKKKFVADGIFNAELNELFTRELSEDGYSGIEVRVTPMRIEIIIRATRTQNVLGERGKRIREMTSLVQKRFGFPNDGVELYVEKVANRGLCATAQTESLRYKLLGGLAVRRPWTWCTNEKLYFQQRPDNRRDGSTDSLARFVEKSLKTLSIGLLKYEELNNPPPHAQLNLGVPWDELVMVFCASSWIVVPRGVRSLSVGSLGLNVPNQ